jgi:hypothetical protein
MQNELKKGDRVNVAIKDGDSFEFITADISSEAIIGVRFDGKPAQQILPLNEIAKIEKIIHSKISQPSNTENVQALLIVGVIVVAFVIAGSQGWFSDYGDWL